MTWKGLTTALRRLAWWRKEADPLIVSLRVVDRHDNSPLHTVSEKWLKRQDRINEAVCEMLARYRDFTDAQEKLGEAVRSEGERPD